ncbi:hypothetical protein [Chengkuizengella marina]|uniref:Uncharacterized protein n=1 Tax=Chengkuizengella marina TaxID=2507566 RepID=A0A6N9Q6N2_9BACL|nr:hypothetical protein [Chengkuizengella marina]NBI30555.1 hypothetical protein [Chengkuizengella marina]
MNEVAYVPLTPSYLPIILLVLLVVGIICFVLFVFKIIRYFVNNKNQLIEINQKLDKITRD